MNTQENQGRCIIDSNCLNRRAYYNDRMGIGYQQHDAVTRKELLVKHWREKETTP